MVELALGLAYITKGLSLWLRPKPKASVLQIFLSLLFVQVSSVYV